MPKANFDPIPPTPALPLPPLSDKLRKVLRQPLFLLALICSLPVSSHAADSPFDLDPGSLKKYAMPPAPSTAKQPVAAQGSDRYRRYTLKPGEDLRKVLYRKYRLSGAKADRVLDEIRKVNHLPDLSSLQPGSTLLIPAVEVRAAKATHRHTARRGSKAAKAASGYATSRRKTTVRPPLKERPVAAHLDAARQLDAEVEQAKQIWKRLVPASASSGSFDYRSSNFALALDPRWYPVLPALDGGSILVDGRGTLPAQVKALIQEKNPELRIVTESPAERREFYRALLSAAQFYSLEEDFSVHFGTDPMITLRSDFKIEKVPESLMRHDITLLNVSRDRQPTPQGLVALLGRNGFHLLETAPQQRNRPPARDLLYQISLSRPENILDSMLNALSIPFETGKRIDVYGRDNIGVTLEVPVDRYFEYEGRKYAVSLFDGDTVNYTLTGLLEMKGYQVIILHEGDDFRSVAEQLLSRLQLPGSYAEHELWPERGASYGVRLSGVMIRGSRVGGRNIFLTERHIDQLVQELAESNGYRLLRVRDPSPAAHQVLPDKGAGGITDAPEQATQLREVPLEKPSRLPEEAVGKQAPARERELPRANSRVEAESAKTTLLRQAEPERATQLRQAESERATQLRQAVSERAPQLREVESKKAPLPREAESKKAPQPREAVSEKSPQPRKAESGKSAETGERNELSGQSQRPLPAIKETVTAKAPSAGAPPSRPAALLRKESGSSWPYGTGLGLALVLGLGLFLRPPVRDASPKPTAQDDMAQPAPDAEAKPAQFGPPSCAGKKPPAPTSPQDGGRAA